MPTCVNADGEQDPGDRRRRVERHPLHQLHRPTGEHALDQRAEQEDQQQAAVATATAVRYGAPSE